MSLHEILRADQVSTCGAKFAIITLFFPIQGFSKPHKIAGDSEGAVSFPSGDGFGLGAQRPGIHFKG
jgi:hypothetical protein